MAGRREVPSYSLYASPAYLAQHGQPTSPAELAAHRLLGNSANPALNRWMPAAPDDGHEAQGHTRTDNTAAIVALALHGVGIARIVDLVAQPLVRSGALVNVLADQLRTGPVPMFAVMLQGRHRLPKVRAFIDHLAESIAEPKVG